MPSYQKNSIRKRLKFPQLSGNIDCLTPTTGTFTEHLGHFLYLVTNSWTSRQPSDIFSGHIELFPRQGGSFPGLNYQYFHKIQSRKPLNIPRKRVRRSRKRVSRSRKCVRGLRIFVWRSMNVSLDTGNDSSAMEMYQQQGLNYQYFLTTKETSTVSWTRFLERIFGQEGIFSYQFYQGFRSC